MVEFLLERDAVVLLKRSNAALDFAQGLLPDHMGELLIDFFIIALLDMVVDFDQVQQLLTEQLRVARLGFELEKRLEEEGFTDGHRLRLPIHHQLLF